MTVQQQDLSAILTRIQALESSNRRLRRIILGSLIALMICVVCLGSEGGQQDAQRDFDEAVKAARDSLAAYLRRTRRERSRLPLAQLPSLLRLGRQADHLGCTISVSHGLPRLR